jgi:flagellar protein FliL
MAREEENKEVEAPAEKPKKKTLLIVLGVVFLIIAVGAPVAFFTLKKAEIEEAPADAATNSHEVQPEGHNDEEELQEGEKPLGAIFPLDTFVVNVVGGGFLRIQIQLEFVDREISPRFYSRSVLVRDALVSLLSKQQREELLSNKGKEDLKVTVKDAVNGVLRKELINRVFFTQFVVQQ